MNNPKVPQLYVLQNTGKLTEIWKIATVGKIDFNFFLKISKVVFTDHLILVAMDEDGINKHKNKEIVTSTSLYLLSLLDIWNIHWQPDSKHIFNMKRGTFVKFLSIDFSSWISVAFIAYILAISRFLNALRIGRRLYSLSCALQSSIWENNSCILLQAVRPWLWGMIAIDLKIKQKSNFQNNCE